jgi:hypothetical protein
MIEGNRTTVGTGLPLMYVNRLLLGGHPGLRPHEVILISTLGKRRGRAHIEADGAPGRVGDCLARK